ncbi:ribbon-helix-helix domain-containing protein [Bremerella sp. T1]|uniref:ribbon-helix-helix domain-containing protein n=1 Tax=Bremerella sp. TYQ1 TaxID=3119568 RepID=UPI001CCBEB8B|nr:type II toxin-antitoxin system ParD family antitoxin [Bremerella volcania]UBM34807.1 type II toxin-antitoxin system ParD family antitoxin [Bremerella volcania]
MNRVSNSFVIAAIPRDNAIISFLRFRTVYPKVNDVNVKLPNNQEAFLQSLVASGRFASEADAMAEAVRLLAAQEQLRAELAKGMEQLDSGERLTEEEVFPDILAELAALEERRS